MIDDKFTKLSINKQQRYQVRHKEKGLCLNCNRKRAKTSNNYCEYHRKLHNKLTFKNFKYTFEVYRQFYIEHNLI